MPRILSPILLISLFLARCAPDQPATPTRPTTALPLPNVLAGPRVNSALLAQVKQRDTLPVLENNADASQLHIALPHPQAGLTNSLPKYDPHHT